MAAKKGSTPWNKGTAKGFIDNRGYRAFKIGDRTIREHRLVMEKHLGRKLEAWEHIHHKDEDKLNNSIENLEIIDAESHAKEHAGKKRTDQQKITMATIRTMREEIKNLQKINSEMLEALEFYAAGKHIRQDRFSGGDYEEIIDRGAVARAAIKKAKGEL